MTHKLIAGRVFFMTLAVLQWLLLPAMAAGRMKSEVTCEPTDKPMMYHCIVKLRDRNTGQPIEGAKFMMHTSMPSMPMAHNMPPVEGKPGGQPGVYQGMVQFEMAGEWAIDIRTSAPSRDQMIHRIMVHKTGADGEHEGEMKHQMKKQE